MKTNYKSESNSSVLWYEKEAQCWEEALPIGNGRLGAMVYSGAVSDRLQINEDTLWTGSPQIAYKGHSLKEFDGVRNMIREQQYQEAHDELADIMQKIYSQGYISYGNIFVDILSSLQVKDYKRSLDMERGAVQSSFRIDEVDIEKTVFSSLKDDVLVYHVRSSKPCDLHVYQAAELENSVRYEKDSGTITTLGRCPASLKELTEEREVETDEESIHFCSRVSVITDGSYFSGGNSLWVKNASETTILFALNTSFNGYDKLPFSEGREYINKSAELIMAAKQFTFEELLKRHIFEYQKYYSRVFLRIDGKDYSYLPTDVRIKNAAAGTVDNGLVTLLFHYARYLTISCSMPGTQPANLQGIWCYHLIAPWNSNYTMNINTQMNYWPTETIGLPECHMPYMKMMKELAEKGNNLGLRGWAAWHNSDIWRFNQEASSLVKCGFWPMGGAWSTRHIWEHYLHTRDTAFLREYYPVMAGAAAFLEDWMIEDGEGYLTTSPSTSPENMFRWKESGCAAAEGSAMDMCIIYDLYDKLIQAAETLGEDTAHYKEVLNKLRLVEVGEDGRILEWGKGLQDYDYGHRHISQLYGLYPADIWKEEKYERAVAETLRVRLENGGGHTGWSNAWIACVYARLRDSQGVSRHIRNMFAKSIYPNMLDAHPPFQIDGNFGICAAVCEALMQSHTGEIQLLPATPVEWESGEVRGFVTRTGETLSFAWKDGKAWRID